MRSKPGGNRFLALGDSYTIGEKVPTRQRWPLQLADRLRKKGIPMDEPIIIAKTGWTTDELMKGIKEKNPSGLFDLVTLLIGVNNQYRRYRASDYRQEFTQLLDQAIKFAGGKAKRVLVLSIPDWGVMPFAQKMDHQIITHEISIFNKINKEITQNKGALYVNITPLSRKAKENPSLVAEDGLHPSGKMYTTWVDLMFPKAMDILRTVN
jgi:lysophospholipase L1-like esterase